MVSMRKIIAWETDAPDLIVWGTHNAREATDVAKKFYENEMGDVPRSLFWQLNLAAGLGYGRFYGHPSLPELETWPNELVSHKEPVDGWVPYLVVQW